MGLLRKPGEQPVQGFPGVEELAKRSEPWFLKLATFLKAGYKPHEWQLLAHTSLARWVVMGAGRRGGKTRSAAWEAAYFADPRSGHEALKLRGVNIQDNECIVGAVVTPEYAAYPTTYREFLEALQSLGIEYVWNKTDRAVGIPNLDPGTAKSIIYFKGASEPDRLRGAGWHWSWWDEPAFIKGSEAWDTGRAQLAQTRGTSIFSTTPGSDEANWWFYNNFISDEEQLSDVEYVEWLSIENPYFPKVEWEELYRQTHPLIFRREYMAKWERGGGNQLKLDWLAKWAFTDRDLVIACGRDPEKGEQIDWSYFRIYAGIDPAISTANTADYFSAWVMAIDPKTGIGYLVDLIHDRLDFPSQLDAINTIQLKWRPWCIGVEDTAYQRALLQQASRLSSLPILTPIKAVGKKEERILSIGPAFREGRVRVRKEHGVFWTEWAEFPDSKHDDTLDAADIVLRTAGTMMPEMQFTSNPFFDSSIPRTIEDLRRSYERREKDSYDEHMGGDW